MYIWLAAAIDNKEYGGVGRCLREIAGGLSSRGHRCVVITAPPIRWGSNYLVFAAYLMLRLIAAVARPPDFIIARSSDAALSALLARLVAKKTRIVLHNHGWEEKVYALEQRLPAAIVQNGSTWKALALRFPLLRLTLRLSAVCACGTLDEVRWLKKRFPKYKSKYRLIPNGVHVAANSYWPNQPQWPFVFLVIGANTWKKNIDYTIGLFYRLEQMLPESRFVIIGASAASLPQAGPLVARGSLTLLPNQSFTLTEAWYRCCPFLISSSRYEGGHSFAVLEAMAQGCVVFGSAIAATGEIIHDKENGRLLTGFDVEPDLRTILASVKDQGALRRMGAAAFATARRNRWERQIGRWEKMLQETAPKS
ncbi:MAG: glycosyltransferase family 4 protein [Chitinivibrionales bacterium]|nr:glycosyltransferase family 4 protein [Chitinivibrionales bacterium]